MAGSMLDNDPPANGVNTLYDRGCGDGARMEPHIDGVADIDRRAHGDREKPGATPPSHRMSLPFQDTNRKRPVRRLLGGLEPQRRVRDPWREALARAERFQRMTVGGQEALHTLAQKKLHKE